jgi:excisionase family DNA binding protein
MTDKLLTIEEASKYLDIHPMTLYKWAKKKKIPAAKLGRNWRFRKEILDAWIDKHTGGK